MTNPLVAASTYNKLPVPTDPADLPSFLTREHGKIEQALKFATRHAATVFNVLDYGADPRGRRLSSFAFLNAAIAAGEGGGGIVWVPDGRYLVDLRVHPRNADWAMAFYLPNNVYLVGPGAGAAEILLAPIANAVPAGCTATWKGMITSIATPSGGNRNVGIRGLTINGNAANQTFVPPDSMHGAFLNRTRGAWFEDVVVKNLYGELPGPPGETTHFEASRSADVHFKNCHAYGDDGGETATGFSANNSTGIGWEGCTAYGMTHGQGFTHWTSALLRYANCHAYLNDYAGFNSEISEHVSYVGCHGGGRSANASGVFTAAQNLGNRMGFRVMGSTNVRISGGTASYNTTGEGYGVHVLPYTGPINSTDVSVDNVDIVGNDYGVYVADANQLRVTVTATCRFASNGTANYGGAGNFNTESRYAEAPIEAWVAGNGTSGARFDVTTGATTNGYRFMVNGNNCLGIIEQGGVKSEIAFAVPVATKTAAYSATYTDHTLLCDATSAAFTVTLPTAASAPGRLYVIKKIDASANAVTVDGNGAETIDDAASYALTVQYQSVKLQSDGTEWWVQ